MSNHHKINYLEIPVKDIKATKAFFEQVFAWSFTDYGPEYTCFNNGGIDGGFFKADKVMTTAAGGALIVLYSKDLEKTEQSVVEAGGQVTVPVFSFPGGRRFHFTDTNGNEFAVWSE